MEMKREIKFRAWDNVDYMSKPFTLQDIQDKKTQFTSDCIVMQYTGLKDKNGKEIYEGDILHHPLNERWFDWLIEIIDGSTMLINIGIDGYRHDPMLLTQQSASGRIIIGNIYENPELLK